jgi:SAM-dependent methyltransferase
MDVVGRRTALVDAFLGEFDPFVVVLQSRPETLRERANRVADLAKPLPFEDASFDVIVASLVLHYVRDWAVPLRELRRVRRHDGAVPLLPAPTRLSSEGSLLVCRKLLRCLQRRSALLGPTSKARSPGGHGLSQHRSDGAALTIA